MPERLVSHSLTPHATSEMVEGAPGTQDPAETLKRKKNKVRSAWISFVSRILAQLIGAAATVILGLAVLQRYQLIDPADGATAATSRPRAAQPTAARDPTPAGEPYLAVLPFENFSGNPQHDNFANALTEVVVTTLSQVETFRVVSRTSSMHYKGARKPLPEIGRELGVDLVVEGSVLHGGGRLRVIAQLIDARRDEHVWAASYDRGVREPLSLQEELARAIVRDLEDALAKKSRWRITTSPRSGADQWQEPLPESRKDAPATGMKSQR